MTEAYSGQAGAARDLNDAVAALGAAAREHAAGLQYADTALAAYLGDSTVAVDRTSALSDAIRSAGREARDYTDSVRDAAAATSGLAANLIAANAASGGGWTGGTTSAATAAIIARNIVNSGRTTSNTGDPAVMAALGACSEAAEAGAPAEPGAAGAADSGAASSAREALEHLRRGAGHGQDGTPDHHVHHGIPVHDPPGGSRGGRCGGGRAPRRHQPYTSGTSLYNATEALGGAYGKTFGSYLGLGSSFQADQNMANGGVYGIAGGVLNLAGQGRDAFSNMGVQTIAMIDRGIANMVLNNRMSQVAGALRAASATCARSGTWRQPGRHPAEHGAEPSGARPDLLGTLKGTTGALACTTGFLGKTGLLGPLLAGEAGYRWGDLVLAGGKMPWFLGGKQVGGLSGLAARMRLGTTRRGTDRRRHRQCRGDGDRPVRPGRRRGGGRHRPGRAPGGGGCGAADRGADRHRGTVRLRDQQGKLRDPRGPADGRLPGRDRPVVRRERVAADQQGPLPGSRRAGEPPRPLHRDRGGQKVTVGVPIAELMREGIPARRP